MTRERLSATKQTRRKPLWLLPQHTTNRTMNTRSVRIQRAVLCSFLSAGLSSAAMAQTPASSTAKPDEQVVLEKFVVTGSLIPVAAGSTTIPIKIVSTADIDNTGINTDLAD